MPLERTPSSAMNRKQKKNLYTAIGILVGVVVVLSILGALT